MLYIEMQTAGASSKFHTLYTDEKFIQSAITKLFYRIHQFTTCFYFPTETKTIQVKNRNFFTCCDNGQIYLQVHVIFLFDSSHQIFGICQAK